MKFNTTITQKDFTVKGEEFKFRTGTYEEFCLRFGVPYQIANNGGVSLGFKLFVNKPEDVEHNRKICDMIMNRIENAIRNHEEIVIPRSKSGDDYLRNPNGCPLIFGVNKKTKARSKLANVAQISTSNLLNKFCYARQQNEKYVCFHCYAEQMKPIIMIQTAINHAILTHVLLTEDQMPIAKNPKLNKFFRFEAFGDLENELQTINYLKIASALEKQGIKCALWTKNHTFLKNALEIAPRPKNLTLIWSVDQLDKNVKQVEAFLDKNPYFDFAFEVFSPKVFDKMKADSTDGKCTDKYWFCQCEDESCDKHCQHCYSQEFMKQRIIAERCR